MRRSIVVVIALVGSLLAAGGSASAASTTTAASITACIKALPYTGHHTFTVSEALQCAPGARVIPAGQTAMGIFIVDSNGSATINDIEQTAPRTAQVANSGCWNRWEYLTANFWSPDSWGSMYGPGYGNNCGYSNAWAYPPQIGCICTGWTRYWGSYDSNYGARYFGSRAAVAWGNIDFQSFLIHWTSYLRVQVATNGGAIAYGWSG